MNQFKDFNIKPPENVLVGDKIPMYDVLNRQITIHGYEVVNSKYEKGSGKCLNLQIEIDEKKRVLFTGSRVLMRDISQVTLKTMAGTIVKTKQGKQGKTKYEDQLIYIEVMDNSIPHMERVRQVPKVQVYFDDGTKMLCNPKNLQFIGHWD